MNPDPDPCPFPREKIPEELLAYMRETFNLEEFLAEIREMEETGGCQFEDIIGELEALASGREQQVSDFTIVRCRRPEGDHGSEHF